jgi:hypothetical protein
MAKVYRKSSGHKGFKFNLLKQNNREGRLPLNPKRKGRLAREFSLPSRYMVKNSKKER